MTDMQNEDEEDWDQDDWDDAMDNYGNEEDQIQKECQE